MDRAEEGLVPGLERVMSTAAPSPVAVAVAELVERSRFEVLPLDGIEERVLEHVPRDVTLTVTVSPTKGLETTLGLAERLVGHGYAVVPHLSARLVESRKQLAELRAKLEPIGVEPVGNTPEQAAKFLADEVARWARVIKAAGVKAEQ